MSTIYVPKKINVGYQNRNDTYTGKLAYVIYYDEKGKLRKETSWNSWRDKKIPNNEFENIPTEGFVLNKHAGGVENSWGWNARKSYCRVYDPRGFEFEITIENLLYILENCSSIKGKGLEGEFVYAWDGKDLFLMPVGSPDYKKVNEYSNTINNNLVIKAKDLVIGATYLTKDNKQWIYMGKYDEWDEWCYTRDDCEKVFKSYNKLEEWCYEHDIKKDNNGVSYYYPFKYNEVTAIVGKRFVFYCNGMFEWKSSITNKLISVLDSKCCDNYAELFYKLEGTKRYSPIDEENKEYVSLTYEEFLYYCTYEGYEGKIRYKNSNFISHINGEYLLYEAKNESYLNDKFIIDKITNNTNEEVLDIFPTMEKKFLRWGGFGKTYLEKHMIPVTLREIYDVMHPMCRQLYLKNGRKYDKEFRL